MLCSEYGWSLDQAFGCTKGQIEALSDSISKRKEAEAEFQAAMHGAQLKKTQDNTVQATDTDQLRRLGIHVEES